MKKLIRFIKEKIIKPIIGAKDKPSAIALGAFIGVFIGFSPFVGFQTILVFAIIAGLRLLKVKANMPVGYALTWISNPFTMIPMYFLEYKFGNLLLGGSSITITDFELFINSITIQNFIGKFFKFGAKIAVPLLLGFFITGLIFAISAFIITYFVIKKRRQKQLILKSELIHQDIEIITEIKKEKAKDLITA